MKVQKRDLLPLILCPIIWGSYYVVSQKLVGYTSVFTSGLSIRFVTMLILSVIMWKRGELPLLLKTKGVLGRLLLIGTFGFLLDLTAFIGLSMCSAASGSALLKCDIIMVNLMSMIIYKQKFGLKFWLWTLLMLVGVFFVMDIDFSTFQVGDPGNIFFLLSAFFVSCNAFVIKSVQHDKNNPASDDVVAFYNNFVTMIYFAVTSMIMGTIDQVALFAQDGTILATLLLAGLGQTLIYVVYYHNLRRYPVWLVKTFLLLMPVVSTLITVLLFKEALILKQCAGILVILVGAMGVLMDQKA